MIDPISLAADAVRHPRHPRRPASGSLHRRGDGADLPDLDLRAGGGRAAEGRLRLLEHGFAFASGMAATTTVMHLLSPGDQVVSVNDVYGGTYRLFSKVYEPRGVRFAYLSADQCNTELERHLGGAKMLWLESPTNPLLNVVDIAAAAEAAHAVGAILVVDNTFASPYLQRPIELGADIVVHSATKYLGGHSDLVSGF